MARTLEDIEKDIKDANAKLQPFQKKLAKGKKLNASESRNKSFYENNLKRLEEEKKNFGKPSVNEKPPVVNNGSVDKPNGGTGSGTGGKSLEKQYQESLKKQQELADQLNDANLRNKKLEDEKSTLEQVQKGVDQVDEATEANIPTWFWREAQEMAPTDKAKRGFIITNHILNRLGTTTGNIGAIVQNAGGSGGASIKEHGGSLIDQYRQGKLEQAIANRKTKQNARMQFQLDAYTAAGAEENRMREVQRKLRNSGYWGNFERLSIEQQVYLQGLLYSDTKGEITNAMIGNLIDQIMKGKDVSLEQVAVNSLAAAGVDNLDTIVKEAKSWGEKALDHLFGSKPGSKPGE